MGNTKWDIGQGVVKIRNRPEPNNYECELVESDLIICLLSAIKRVSKIEQRRAGRAEIWSTSC